MDISVFLNRNRIEKKNEFFAASESFRDGEEVILWEIRALSGSEEERIRSLCMRQVQKKNGGYTEELDYNKYLSKIAAASTVYPDLFSEELQISYGVWGEEQLLKEMLSAGEYIAYLKKVKEVNGFNKSNRELIDESKN